MDPSTQQPVSSCVIETYRRNGRWRSFSKTSWSTAYQRTNFSGVQATQELASRHKIARTKAGPSRAQIFSDSGRRKGYKFLRTRRAHKLVEQQHEKAAFAFSSTLIPRRWFHSCSEPTSSGLPANGGGCGRIQPLTGLRRFTCESNFAPRRNTQLAAVIVCRRRAHGIQMGPANGRSHVPLSLKRNRCSNLRENAFR